jgi:peptidoglycan/xylan/chitin deacetylase (PgdA/CDA1 family)
MSMYLDISLKKLLVMGAILLSFVAVIWGTFMVTETRFGSLHIWQALGRTLEKNVLYAWYSVRYAGVAIASSALITASNAEGYSLGEDAKAIPVLVYHTLPKDNESDHVPRKVFMDQMFALKRAGWNAISLADFEAYLRSERTLPERSFLITFDDGARDSYYPSDPVLKLLDYRAVSFILPKYSAGEGTFYYLSSGEVSSMLKSGRWEVQSHGLNSHEFFPVDAEGTTGPALANLLWLPEEGRMETVEEYRERITSDLTTARQMLEETFGHPITAFAFPFGEFGQLSINNPEAPSIVESTAEDIYDLSFYQTWPGEGFSYNYPREGLDMIKRIRVRQDWTGERLLAELERGLPKRYELTDSFDRDIGWFSIWGKYTIENGSLHMKSLPDQSGSAALLDGTGHWDDYYFEATLESPSRTSVTLHARYADHDNNAACNFGNGFIHAEDTVEGVRRVINGVRDESIVIPAGEFTVGIRVEGRTIACYFNGEKIVETPFLEPSLIKGGIGLKTWDPVLGTSEIRVKEIRIEPVEKEALVTPAPAEETLSGERLPPASPTSTTTPPSPSSSPQTREEEGPVENSQPWTGPASSSSASSSSSSAEEPSSSLDLQNLLRETLQKRLERLRR